MLITAFIIGIVGSFHCIGMCGPIALALPVQNRHALGLLWNRVLYNSGRVITYMMIGVVFGLVGQGFSMAGLQQVISIAAGVAILLMVLLPQSITAKIYLLRPAHAFVAFLKSKFSILFKKKSGYSTLLIGLLNGFLPCGLVYIAVAGAMATGSIRQGALYMGFFGLGTIPVMLAVSIAGNFIGLNVRRKIGKWVPVFLVVLAFLFILRGMNLGIPYISPDIQSSSGVDHAVICH
jgi:sulfite exporter TauE/SafE